MLQSNEYSSISFVLITEKDNWNVHLQFINFEYKCKSDVWQVFAY